MHSPSLLASLFQRPCTESKLIRWAWVAASPAGSLICTNSNSGQLQAARRARRPIRPKPLIPTLMLMLCSLKAAVCGRLRLGDVELADVVDMRRVLNRTGAQYLHVADRIAEWNAALDQQLCSNQAGATRTALAVNGDALTVHQQSPDPLAIGVPRRPEQLARCLVVLHRQVKPLDVALSALLRQIFDFVLGQLIRGH